MSNQTKLEVSDAELEIARLAVEDEIIWRRDNNVFEFRNNGLCCKDRDGPPNPMIRMSIEEALRVGLQAINKQRGVA